ncbi:UNVERIFIED_CONTAM: hypothetical protein HDU68_010039 [Siphonaria sp. JEL0065]|nr:hypothetical protein HDU68_010039 [Siphonaria sp. JEL0065]
MEYRHLEQSGLKVSALSLGSWLTFGAQVDDDLTEQCMKVAYENGMNFFDNAEMYAGGKAELAMGKAIKKLGWKRSSFVISTKIFGGGSGVNEKGLSRKHLIEGTKACLARLQLDYVDLIYAHRPDPDTPMEEIVRGFNYLIEKGFAFYWGTSEWSAEEISEGHRVADRLGLIHPIMEQPEYNMFNREKVEKEYAPLYAKYGLGTTTYSPLDGGILSGKYNKDIPVGSRFSNKDSPMMKMLAAGLEAPDGKEKIAKVERLMVIAEKLDVTVAQLALAWILKNPNVTTVITGASKPSQVLENVKAIAVVSKLTEEIVAEIEGILNNKPERALTFR